MIIKKKSVVVAVVVIQVLLFFISLYVDRSKTHPAKHIKKEKKNKSFSQKKLHAKYVRQMVAEEGDKKKGFFY